MKVTWNRPSGASGFRIEGRKGAESFRTMANAPGSTTFTVVTGLLPATTYDFRVFAQNGYGTSSASSTASGTTLPASGGCTPTDTTLCLSDERFAVSATYDAGSKGSGPANVVALTEDTGYLWFFASSNVECLVKVLNACGINNSYWVFAAGLTNVNVVVTVTDSQSGTTRRYENLQGVKFAPVQDTAAFASCP